MIWENRGRHTQNNPVLKVFYPKYYETLGSMTETTTLALSKVKAVN